MKAVILAGGFGTRLSEETVMRPKPMVEIGGMPILWHIMKIYAAHGVNDFIICCGYKSYYIKEYFANYALHCSDVTIDFKSNSVEFHNNRAENWKVTLVDTGNFSMTGGRLKRVQKYLNDESEFFFTYGDGVADIDITKLLRFHRGHGKDATITACHPPGRFGALEIERGEVTSFVEKPSGDGGRINAGFFILKPNVFNLIQGDETIWEQEPLKNLTLNRQLAAFEHDGFWQPMDTVRDRDYLDGLWQKGNAPWKVWD